MNVWYHLSTIFNLRRILRSAVILTLLVAFITMLFFGIVAKAAPGVNQTISFQGRLLASNGQIVPNGNYNIQFKIYQGGSGTAAGNPDGELRWTETYTNNGASTGVKVVNGYMTVNLGANTPFGSSIDWNNDTLWLSMNIAGLTTGCSTFGAGVCTADGEMTPMKRLTATPYALNAGMLGGLSADRFLQLDGEERNGSFNLNGTARANTLQGNSMRTGSLDSIASEGTLNIGATNAQSINIGTNQYAQNINIGTSPDGIKNVTIGSTQTVSSTTIQGGNSGVAIISSNGVGIKGNTTLAYDNIFASQAGRVTIRMGSTEAFQVANSNGDPVLTVTDDRNIVTAWNSSLMVGGSASFAYGVNIQGNPAMATYITPGGASLPTAINISNYTVGSYGSILAFGLPAASSPTARGMLVADGRTGNHQATIGVLSPDEDQIMGFSWNGSNSTGYLTNTANSLALQGAGVNIITANNSGGQARVGIGNAGTSGHALDVTGDINASTNFSLGGISVLDSSKLKFNSATMAKVEAGSGQGLQLVADGGVKIGDSTASGDPTLLTLDRSSTTPTATGDALLGSMYYDTTLGKVQCYEADGWGSCSSSPDTYVSLNPQYANSVTNGSGIGTLNTEFCSDALNINDGSSGQPAYCGTNETYNLQNWTTAETTAQSKSIFVTHKLPENFKRFASGSTSLIGAKSTNATTEFQVYKSNASGLVACGSPTAITATNAFQEITATGTADPANCSFEAGDSIVFRIILSAQSGGTATSSTIGFAYNND